MMTLIAATRFIAFAMPFRGWPLLHYDFTYRRRLLLIFRRLFSMLPRHLVSRHFEADRLFCCHTLELLCIREEEICFLQMRLFSLLCFDVLFTLYYYAFII